MANARSRCGASATRSSRRPSTTFPRAPTRTSRAIDILAQVLGDTPSGRLHKALVESKKASSVFGFNFQWREPTIAMLAAEVRIGSSLDAARDALLETIEGLTAAPPTKDEVERARAQLLKTIELNLNRSDTIGLTLSEFIGAGDWRLYLPPSRSAAQGHDRTGRQRRGEVLQAIESNPGSVHPDETAGSCRDSGDAGPRRDAQGLQGRCRDRRRRGLRAVSSQYRKTHQPKRRAVRTGHGAAPEKDARRHRRRAARAAVWERTEPHESRRCRLAHRRHADARDGQKVASADSGRTGPAQGAPERRRRRNAGDGVRRDDARQPGAGVAAPGRSAARAGIPGGGTGAAEAGTARLHRAAEERADAGRVHGVQPPSRSLSEGGRAIHPNPRRADRGHRMPPRCSRSSSSIATSMAPRTRSSP